MILTRTIVRSVNPLWASVTARYSSLQKIRHTTCCKTISPRVCPKRGINGESEEYDPRACEIFSGYWLETQNDNFRNILKAAGVKESDVDRLENIKTWMSYHRDDEGWLYTYGDVKTKRMHITSFQFGKPVDYYFYDNQLMKGVIYPDTNMMREIYESMKPPSTILIIEKKIDIDDKKKMLVTLEIDDVISTKCYEKRPQPD